ncbi:TonB-dependent siderophore receptor [Caulobacter sp. RHG1]|uniref:TonB-dependent receptor n=1 Tax=Caulobacter sp. (strain RHG1) TaxID=2545762 RepID=UPI0015548D91|nr:TonB-dependent siderophore receptor [Caulobacter sp. RHG1]NQE61757.1 Ferrichrome-iron receptor [Caulobacter sp. RHG1]
MRKSTSAGVMSRPRHALSVAAVAGLAGLGLAQAAIAAPDMAADAPVATAPAADKEKDKNEVSSVSIDAKRTVDPSSSKFTAPLLDTPRSVTVIPSRIIEQTAATSLQDILRTSPGITFGAGEGGQPLADRPFIRGQSSGNNIFVDGVRDTGGQTREVFNLEQVEVVKGPDSVYSGRGSGGGSINLSTKTPKAKSFASGSAAAGTDSYYRVTADGNYALTQNAAFRVNLMATGGDTPGRDHIQFKRWGVAPSVAVGIDTQTQATLSFYHLDTDQDPDYGIPLASKRTWGVAGTDGRTRPANGILDVSRNAYYGLDRDWMKTKADIGTFAIRHEINDDLAVRQVIRLSKTVNDYFVTNPGDGGAAQFVAGEWWMLRGTKSRWNDATTTAFVTDLTGKFDLGGMENRFNLGLELSREINENASYTFFTTGGSACPTGFTGATAGCTRLYAPNPGDAWTGVIKRGPASESKTRNGSIYGFDTVHLTEKLLLNVGVRYDDYSTQGVNATATTVNGVVTGVTYATLPKGGWDFVNYQVGLNYKPTPSSSLYVSYATSSTPPNIAGGDQNTAATPAQVVLDPEDSTSIEAGAKWNVFHDKLALSGAVFRTERKNAQIALSATEIAQAGEVRVQGLELGVSGNVTRAWQVFGGYTYMDSELVKGPYTSVNIGDPLANTPKHTVSVFSTYRVIPALSVGGGVYYVSKMFGGNQGGAGGGTNKVFAPSYTRLDAFASYRINSKVDLQLNVQNLTDKRYIARTNGVHHADPAPGRQAILTLAVKY